MLTILIYLLLSLGVINTSSDYDNLNVEQQEIINCVGDQIATKF